jgi:pseudouridine-5'-phosphate glycosidase
MCFCDRETGAPSALCSKRACTCCVSAFLSSVCPGCDRQQLEHIARKGLSVRKVSRRDMPLVIGSGLDGATTVSGTMLLAARAGIKVFVTGGIGGVHR